MEFDKKLFGRQIRKYRRRRGYTQKELADATGISYEHISHIETGTHLPSYAYLMAIANALQVDPGRFFDGNFNAKKVRRMTEQDEYDEELSRRILNTVRDFDREQRKKLIENYTIYPE